MKFEKNRVCQLFKIKYPIIQGGMAGISESNLVSAVSNAGGLGVIGSGLMPASWLEREIKKTREKTKNPFGVNLFLQNPRIEDLVKVIIRERVEIVFTGGGNPLPLFPYLQAAGIKIVPVVPSPRLAKKMEDNGADAVVVEGLEAGGHIGQNTTFCLIPQAKKILKKIPLIAAGGIFDGKTAKGCLFVGCRWNPNGNEVFGFKRMHHFRCLQKKDYRSNRR
jgi:enoyl-[acyl-carrier protein] reductase II